MPSIHRYDAAGGRRGGKRHAGDMVGELDAAMLSSVVFRSTVLRTVGKATVCNVYAPVRHNGKTLGLVVRETNMATRESKRPI